MIVYLFVRYCWEFRCRRFSAASNFNRKPGQALERGRPPLSLNYAEPRAARRSRSVLSSHPIRPTCDRDDAGARHLDKAERQHQVDELVDLLRPARDLEHEALGGGVDHTRPERIGEPQRLDPVVALA